MEHTAQAEPGTPPPPATATERMLLAVLPPGWRVVGRCRLGTGGPIGQACGCHALAHPAIGIALLDIAPDATPNAEARLRRALSAADFWPAFPGTLPVWHGRLEAGEMRRLPAILAEGFNSLPPLTVPGKDAWIDAVQAALAEEPAWEVPGRPPRLLEPVFFDMDDEEAEAEEPPSPPWYRNRQRLLGLAGTGLAGLGLAAVLLLTEPPGPPSAPAPAPTELAAAAVPSPPTDSGPPAALPPIEAVRLPVIPPPPPPTPAPTTSTQAAPPVPAEAPPTPLPAAAAPTVTPPAVAPAATLPAAAPPRAAEPEEELVLPPPAPRPPPVRRVSAPPPKPRIDPSCTRALFRYQQGAPLSATEAAYVRDGCATRRR